MKYGIILKSLRFLVYIKRFFWWFGSRISFVFAGIFGRFWRVGAFFNYKLNYVLGRSNLKEGRSVFFKRDFLQFSLFIVLVFVAIPQTKVYTQKDTFLPGQKTIAYRLTGSDEDYSLEEVLPDAPGTNVPAPVWKQSAVTLNPGSGINQNVNLRSQQLAGTGAGGSALFKPILIPGAIIGVSRSQPMDYIIEPGDTLGTIADDFGVSVATIIWANNLSLRSIIRPGDKLVVPPTTGVMHLVKKGDTIKKIAKLYDAKEEDIIKFNKLKADGTDLVIGEKIMVPGGVKPQDRVVASLPRTSPSYSQVAVPPGSTRGASVRGFVWPSAAKTITQYYNWSHHALDIAGPFASANYAAKAGMVEKAQCGWNSGYGCYIIINHGGGVKTLYGHHSRLLVSPGDYVEAGQTIGLMGNTGKVRGVTGIHLHFEIQINGVRVNPLGYVR